MATYQRIFVVQNSATIYRLFLEDIAAARRTDLARQRANLPPITRATQRVLLSALRDYEAGLRDIANQTAAITQQSMRDRLDQYIQATGRGSTGRTPNLKMRTTARRLPPLAGAETGNVGVAPEEVLDRAVNPDTPGYGTYWRAIEFGTGREGVPAQRGRVIRGLFTGRAPGYADATRPLAIYRGGGPHPIFIPGSAGTALGLSGIGPRGGKGGYGVIRREIRPAHFIRNGANDGLKVWRRELAALELRTIGALRP